MLRGRVVCLQAIMGVLMTPRGLLLTVSLASFSMSRVTGSADTSHIWVGQKQRNIITPSSLVLHKRIKDTH